MTSELHTVRYEVQHTDYAAVIETCKTVQFIDNIHTLQLIVGRAHQIRHTVYDDQLDAMMLMEVHVERRADDVQPLLARLLREMIGMEKVRLVIEISPLYSLMNILVKLMLRLFRVKEDNGPTRRIRDDGKTQCALGIQRTLCYGTGYDGSNEVALSHALTPGETKKVVTGADGHIIDLDNRRGLGRRILIVQLAGLEDDRALAVEVVNEITD